MTTLDNFVKIYDTTLRDGSQAEGISFSKSDKVRIAEMLDHFGVSYIEGGWPGSNPKDIEFFEAVKGKKFKNAQIAAFGSTKRPSQNVENDDNVRKLLESETPVVTIFGKSWMLHVKDVLRVTGDENLNLIADTCKYLLDNNREVIFDAEHFFDGYKDNRKFAIDTLKYAINNGASTVVLCDTNGGCTTSEIIKITEDVKQYISSEICLGIHCHNDSDLAVANSLATVESGVRHLQGTINGFGERCGNANLCSIIPNLELKMGMQALKENNLNKLQEVSKFVDERANVQSLSRSPFVGDSAFAHKGGMHVNAVNKNPTTFEHIIPEKVGNKRRVLVSDLSGKSNILMKVGQHHLDQLSNDEVNDILNEIKKKENEGYEFETADASFSLLLQKIKKQHKPFFYLDGYRVIIEKRGHNEPCFSEATVKVDVNGEHELVAAEGDGPINALDKALRKALTSFYPEIKNVKLNDYKVRIFEGEDGTAAKTRVLIDSGDNKTSWGTVGVSENIVEASWEALVDSMEYILYQKYK